MSEDKNKLEGTRCNNCPMTLKKCVKKTTSVLNTSVDDKRLKEQILEVSKILYKENKYLFDKKLQEQCIAAYFWKTFIEKYSGEYIGYDIDIEYSRFGDKGKAQSAFFQKNSRKRMRPDMIIHKRGCTFYDFACIEFKVPWSNAKCLNNDYKKLKELTDLKGNYKYKYGVSVVLDKNPTLKWFTDGKEYKAQNESNDEKL